MSYTLNTSPKLPPGANVSVWPRTAFASAAVSGSPPASPVFTGVMGRASLSVPGLTDGRPYVAHASVGGLDRYTEFMSSGPWRLVRDILSGGNLPVAAATGKYIRNTAVASINTNIDTAVISGSVMAEHGGKFRLRVAAFSTGGAGSDPTTTTLRYSLYDVTYAAGTTGATFTLGTEIAASVISGLSPTPRGTLVRGESASFVIDPTKDYAVVAECVTTALPASTSLSGTVAVVASD